MKRPLNFAILKYFTENEVGSAENIYETLKEDYKGHKSLKIPSIIESLMTAKENGLIDEDSFEMSDDKLVIYYKATDDQKKTINYYIK